MPKYELQMDTPAWRWVVQQSFPPPAHNAMGDYLLGLQSDTPTVKVRFICSDSNEGNAKSLRMEDMNVLFQIVPSPIAPLFRVELPLYQLPQKPNQADISKYKHQRLTVEFAANIVNQNTGKYKIRVVGTYKGKDNNDPMTGPTSFSDQLRYVRYSSGDSPDLPLFLKHPNPQSASKEHVFQWQAKSCTKYGFGLPVPPAMSTQTALFKKMIDAVTNKDMYLTVAFAAQNAVAKVYWPFFSAMPTSMPTYFPWVGLIAGDDFEEVMDPEPGRNFELHPEYIKIALASRSRNWFKGQEVASSIIPQSPDIAKLDEFVKFQSGRHYLAVVLGSFLYEAQHARAELGSFYNGEHKCHIFTADGPTEGSRLYVVLLSIRPARTDSGASATMPVAGERVDVHLTYNKVAQNWQGRVIEIPPEHRNLGFNVALHVLSPPTIPAAGRIMVRSSPGQAEFFFGHHGQNTSLTKKRVLALMTNHIKSKQSDLSHSFLRELLLAQDLSSTLSEDRNENGDWNYGGLPSRFNNKKLRLDHIDFVCQNLRLSPEQTRIVHHFFTHRVTLVRGPGGTGKSTLINAIIRIEEEFQQKHWVATDSNEACDVLVRKTCARRGNMQPAESLRVRSMFEERLDYSVSQKEVFNTVGALPESPQRNQGEDAIQAIHRYLASEENIAKAMSLENLIKLRLAVWIAGKGKIAGPLWAKEAEDLRALVDAAKQFELLRLEQKSQKQFDELRSKLERDYFKKLHHVQKKCVSLTRGIFSTTAAASGPLLRHFAPRSIIMDEASQAIEASAVGAIIHAMENGSLFRVLLIGDDQQLPPTIMNDKNPFRSTAETSLFERLITAGAPVFNLSTQYRSEATISSVVAHQIYQPVGLTLQDGQRSTDQAAQDARFRTFVQNFAKKNGGQAAGQTNAIVISPVEDKSMNWKAQRLAGSTSKFNLATARVVIRTVTDLLRDGHYEGRDILVIAFYKDQVQLLDSIFCRITQFKGIKVTTVDGSQGQERPVVVVDCVVLGNANGDGMGFLNADKRRFCVAMMRAQHGRIVVAHKDMGRSSTARDPTPWDGLLHEAKKNQAVLDGGAFNGPTSSEAINNIAKEAFLKFSAGVTGRFGKTTKSATRTPVADYARSAFVQATGATTDEASQYLKSSDDDMYIAIDKYFHDHGDDSPAQDI